MSVQTYPYSTSRPGDGDAYQYNPAVRALPRTGGVHGATAAGGGPTPEQGDPGEKGGTEPPKQPEPADDDQDDAD